MSKYTNEFKLEVARHYESSGDGFIATANKYGVDKTQVRNWVDVYECLGPKGFTSRYVKRTAQSKIAILHQIQAEGCGEAQAVQVVPRGYGAFDAQYAGSGV